MSSKLPDYLAPRLRVVFCGTAAGMTSASRGHYYAGPGNLFWTYLYEARITTEPLFPSTDHRVLEFGVGLTDLAKEVAMRGSSCTERWAVPCSPSLRNGTPRGSGPQGLA
jgi:mismatch-specific thymine-DNA glycosylase